MIASIVIVIASFLVGVFGFTQIIGSLACVDLRPRGSLFFTILLWLLLLSGGGALVYFLWYDHVLFFWIGYGVSFLLSLGSGPSARREYTENQATKGKKFFPKNHMQQSVINACHDALPIYESEIRHCMQAPEDFNEQAHAAIYNGYLFDVQDSIARISQFNSPRAHFRFTSALACPSLAGYGDMDTSRPLSAGYVYALAYYALSGKQAKPRDCVALDRAQNEIMESAVDKIEAELASEEAASREADEPGAPASDGDPEPHEQEQAAPPEQTPDAFIPVDWLTACPSCGYETDKRKNFCEWCGAPLQRDSWGG